MIGAGSHASRNIVPYFHFLEGAEVVANCDLGLEKARRLAGRFGIPRSYSDYAEMVEQERPDGVIVCVDASFHAEAAIELMGRGSHVYTEKPNAVSLQQSREVLQVSRSTGRLCMVGYKKRYAPAYRKAREIIAGERFGEPALLTVLRTKGYNAEGDDPREDYLLRWACHAWDLAPYLFGHVAEVCAFRPPQNTHAYAVALRFQNGAVGSLCLTNRAGPVQEEITAVGTKMVTVRVKNSIFMEAMQGDQPFAAHRPEFNSGAFNSAVEQGFAPELQEFVDAIRDGHRPPSDIAEATHSMAVYEAIAASAETGRTVAVAET
jgi:predicted dehydrogenase